MDNCIPPWPQQPVPPGGDDSADTWFETFYHGEIPRLIAFLMQFGANDQEAADAAQLAFEQLLVKWREVRQPSSWLRTVALRKVLPALVLKRQNSSFEKHEEKYAGRPTPPLDTHIELREEEQRVLWAVRQLPPTQLKVFALHFDEFETREIAEILHMTPEAARQNLARARATLKNLLGLSPSPSPARPAVRESKEEAQ